MEKFKEKLPEPPEAWIPVRKMAKKVAAPVERFLSLETAGGLVLLFNAALALIWANSAWHESYEHLWHTKLTIGIGPYAMSETLHFWINDCLMTIFFLVAGYEIKRELRDGELSDSKRAMLPITAALGGMIVPALIYLAMNPELPGRTGWGVPMATDIAFAVGILSLLGKRIPAAMRILLLALAIIDDLGAILVIAVFYTSEINTTGLMIVGIGMLLLLTWRKVAIRPGLLYMIPLITLWYGFWKAGIHPTLAGVIVGMSAPSRAWVSRDLLVRVARNALEEFTEKTAGGNYDDHDILPPLRRIILAAREAISPVVHGEAVFHPWVAFFIMPLFALANAGVNLNAISLETSSEMMILMGIILGLAVGKPLGVILFSWIAVKAGLAKLPHGMTWRSIAIIGTAAGIGFTMAIFIAELAFDNPAMLGVAKLGVLIATAITAIAVLLVGYFSLPKMHPDIEKVTLPQAERSTQF